MFYQIKNNSIKRNNQTRVKSKSLIFSTIKNNGWVITDCSIIELQDELITNKYNNPDGKNSQ